jgi:hypothetical protein
MAVQVGIRHRSGSLVAAPDLYVIDFERPNGRPEFDHPAFHDPASIGRRRRALRRRRHLRRARTALQAAGWAVGSIVLTALVLAGMAGLR